MPPYGTLIFTTEPESCQSVLALLEKEGFHPQATLDLETGDPFDPMFYTRNHKSRPVAFITVPQDEAAGAQRVIETWKIRQTAVSRQASSNAFKMMLISVVASLIIGSAVFAFSRNSMAAFEAGVVGFVLSFVIALIQFESARKKTQEDSSAKEEI